MSSPPGPPGLVPSLSARARRLPSSTIRDMLALADDPRVLSLAAGAPAPELLPHLEVARACQEVLASGPSALRYSGTEGLPELRAWAATEHPGPAGSEVLVTAGSQQALDLVARALLDPGDTVVVEDPGYVGALQVLRSTGAHLVGVPVDHDGLRVDLLGEQLRRGLRPRLVHTVATFQNPTGATLTDERRRALADLADSYGFVVVDDDPYGRLRWAGHPVEPLARHTDRVVSLGSASKVLAPGLRVGWATVPRWLFGAVVRLKQAADLHTGTLSQAVATRLLTDRRWLDAHVAGLATSYERRARTLAERLVGHLGDRVALRVPDGGMFLWATVDGVDTGERLNGAVAGGVAYAPGSAFAVDADHRTAMRLCVASLPEPALAEAAARLGRVLDATTLETTTAG